MVPCPFPFRKGFCRKGCNCDFSHALVNRTTPNRQESGLPGPNNTASADFLSKLQGVMTMMDHIQSRIQNIERFQQPQVPFPLILTHVDQFPPVNQHPRMYAPYPRPPMQIPLQPSHPRHLESPRTTSTYQQY